MDEGKRAEGEEILRNLMTERGFYPMAAAQKLNATYPVMVAVAAKPRASLVDGPEVARVRELMYWNMDNGSQRVGLLRRQPQPAGTRGAGALRL